MSLSDFSSFLPELSLLLILVLTSIYSFYELKNDKVYLFTFLAGIILTAFFAIQQFFFSPHFYFADNISFDSFGSILKAAVLIGFSLSTTINIFSGTKFDRAKVTCYSVLIFSAFVSISSRNLLLTFVSFELLNFSFFSIIKTSPGSGSKSVILTNYYRTWLISSSLMLFGISVFYGLFGSTNYALISQYITNNPVNVLTLTISILLVFTGFGLKLFTFPFQSVFTKISSGIDFANLSVILTTSVIAGSGAFVRFVNTAFYDSLAFISANNSHTLSPAFNWELFLTIIFCTSILSSAFLLYLQKDFIKIILYYLLINLQFVIITGFEKSSQGISNYLMNIVFILASVIGTSYVTNYFYTVHSVKELKDIRGMFKRSPAPLIFLIVMLLSICGLPLTMGFTIRIYIFSEINQSYGIFIIIASAIAAFICLLIVYRILISAITSVEDSPQILKLNAGQMILPILILIIMFLFGLLPDLLTNFFRFIAIS